jgi:4a-hydroxytetrahydrobiopterin dehydratase
MQTQLRGGDEAVPRLTTDGGPADDGAGMSDLAMRQCVPCKGGTPPLQGPELDDLLAQLGNDWRVVDEHHLEKEYRFTNFREALDFTNRVGELAEEQGHHPDIYLAWGKVRLTIWTHKIDGLTESDFVFAAKSDRALAG